MRLFDLSRNVRAIHAVQRLLKRLIFPHGMMLMVIYDEDRKTAHFHSSCSAYPSDMETLDRATEIVAKSYRKAVILHWEKDGWKPHRNPAGFGLIQGPTAQQETDSAREKSDEPKVSDE